MMLKMIVYVIAIIAHVIVIIVHVIVIIVHVIVTIVHVFVITDVDVTAIIHLILMKDLNTILYI